MIIYSVVPIDVIFSGFQQTHKKETTEIIDWKGTKLEVKVIDNKTCKINRIISTNPFDYLKPELQPERIITACYQPKKD